MGQNKPLNEAETGYETESRYHKQRQLDSLRQDNNSLSSKSLDHRAEEARQNAAFQARILHSF